MNAKKSSSAQAPDFAYPRQVMADADKMLDQALRNADGEAAVDALIRYGLAQSAISPDSMPSVIGKVERVRADVKNKVTASLLDLLLADMYNAYYQANEYNLDRRTSLADPGDDISLWSGNDFKAKIVSLYNSALAAADALKAAKISDYQQIIVSDNVGRLFFPTLYDFACNKAVNTIGELAGSQHILSPRCFVNIGGALPVLLAKPSKDAIAIADRWVESSDGAAKIEALIQRYDLLRNYVVNDSDSDGSQSPMITLFKQNIGNTYAVELLLHCRVNDDNRAELYDLLERWAYANPSYFRINAVKNRISSLSGGVMEITFPSQVAPQQKFDFNVQLQNVNEAQLKIYRVKDSRVNLEQSDYSLGDCESTPVATLDVRSAKKIPFADTVSVSAALPRYGLYVVTGSLEKVGRTRYQAINCSDIAMFNYQNSNDVPLYVVNGVTGAPISGATVNTFNNRRQLSRLNSHTTDADGRVTLRKGDLRSILIQAVKGEDKFSRTTSQYFGAAPSQNIGMAAFIRPALAIYHPGDTMQFVVVAYSYEPESKVAVAQTPIKAELKDVNWQTVDTLSLTTDAYGRAEGKFAIPDEGLTGDYQIYVSSGKRTLGSQTVMVSDYKLPTYKVTADSVAINPDGSVEVIGKAMTYSGFPVQNAQVMASLSGMQRIWWRSNSVEFLTDTIATDAEGNFAWKLTKDELEQTPYLGGCYKASFTVTSASGENQQASREFTLSRRNRLIYGYRSWLPAAADANLPITLADPLGAPLPGRLQLTFTPVEGSPVVIEATAAAGNAKADLSQLRSGTYTLAVKSMDDDAEPISEKGVVVYNTADTNSPSLSPLWVPDTKIKVSHKSIDTTIPYAVTAENQPVMMIVSSGEKVIEQRWLSSGKGMNTVSLRLPADIKSAKVNLLTISDFELYNREITVIDEDPDKTLKVSVERMRDHLTPMTGETLTVRVANGAGKGVGAAVILDMYSKALDALAEQSWQFTPVSRYMPGVYFNDNLAGSCYLNQYGSMKYLNAPNIAIPDFNLYGQSFGYGSMMLYDSVVTMAYGARSTGMRKSAEPVRAVNELKEEVIVDLAEEEAADTSAPVGSEDGGADENETEGEQYRPSEVPLAFFAPMLATDADGNLTYSFTVPNANTTWRLNALAYNDILATDLDIWEAVASKPVMVEPNMPRFLRTGDNATILASVINATDAAADVTTVFEIIDPATGKVIASQSVTSQITARSSAVASFGIDAPSDPTTLMVRFKSTAGNYTDGVQTLLPVLASSQPVVDSSTFYLAPDQTEYSRQLPHAGDSTQVTLSFCENPTWEVVSALPGLRAGNSGSSLSASAQVFAAAVSGYVMNLNPAIRPALKEWLASAKDAGEMLSMLNRNDDLKQLVLAATPWVQDAQSDEERITRLALLFDSKEIDKSMNAGIATLKKLQCGNGGWTWTSNYERPSLWVTLQILNNFAELRQLGCYPSKLDSMVKDALEYVDAEVAREYARYPESDYRFYTYVRSLYKDTPISAGASKAYNSTVQKMVKNWKKYRTAEKAAAALVLYRSQYQNVAGQILGSLREFATTTPELGMWWDSVDNSSVWSLTRVGQTAFILQAFNTIDPECADIDKIRQWLILNKIVQDWGTSVDASACVAAILQCGSSWLNRPGDAVITVGGNKLTPDKMDKLTGQFDMNISGAKGDLTITRTAGSPAWGAVMTRSTQLMRDIEAHSIPELSVSKQILVRGNDGWMPTDNLKVGDVAKVRLTVTAQRDMDYVTIVDNRGACLEPVIQTPEPTYCDGLIFYLENRDAVTNIFVDRLTKGQYIIEYEMNVNNAGAYSAGIAAIQSQYAPEMTAHSAGTSLSVKP